MIVIPSFCPQQEVARWHKTFFILRMKIYFAGGYTASKCSAPKKMQAIKNANFLFNFNLKISNFFFRFLQQSETALCVADSWPSSTSSSEIGTNWIWLKLSICSNWTWKSNRWTWIEKSRADNQSSCKLLYQTLAISLWICLSLNTNLTVINPLLNKTYQGGP